MSWSHIGRYPDQASIAAEANRRRLGEGGLLFTLNRSEQAYDVWVSSDTVPSPGKWFHFSQPNSGKVAQILNDYRVYSGSATVSLDGYRTDYVVVYLSLA